MKKYKKFWAVLLTLAMVLGMSMTTMAAEKKTSADITIYDATEANLTYVQVVEPDATSRTGWNFCGAAAGDDTIAKIFRDAFGAATNDEAIDKLIDAVDASVADANGVISSTNSSTQLATALSKVADSSVTKVPFPAAAENADERVLNVTKAGIYAIQGSETGYTYNNMAAFVSFGEVTDGNYPELQDVKITAKKAPDTIDKVVKDDDHVVPVGSVVTYTITTKVPSVKSIVTDNTFTITDTLIGGTYLLSGSVVDAETGSPVNAIKSVKLGDEELIGNANYAGIDIVPTTNAAGNQTFTIDLKSLINTANTNAGKTVTVTYTAVVTSPDGTSNGAIRKVNDVETPTSEDVKTYSGQITLTKYASDEDNNNLTDNKKLEGAKFKVYKKDATTGNVTGWATFDTNNVFTGWVDTEAAATEITTGTDGTVTVKGLARGTYYFKETAAPTGYHKNTTDSEATLVLDEGTTVATATITAGTFMIDDTMGTLPSTGGIGTTIFTIGGCAIMIAAAFLFFASRKKNNK